ncbi:MAG: DNA polymerase/3'-5' exonuclease PolX [Candidatus Omnitrophica bacterium]|nr:DNA polymerase/3'-5' exonuclease PolX [Candidatus Omnitrophota bacterium]
MTNKQISDIFVQIADILEIKGENIFRVRAYRQAAANILTYARQASDICREDPELLLLVPGIGKDLKEKIVEMVTTGKLKKLDELSKEFSPGFLELLNLSGLGPKTLKKLKDELGIADINDLKKACEEGKIASLAGMGEKTEEKLLEAIEYHKKTEGRMLFQEAYSLSGDVLAYLKRSGYFKKLEAAGSLRRGKETVGDIDILAVSSESQKAMQFFTLYPGIRNVISKGKKKTSIALENGVQIDLRMIEDKCFGSALVYFTGSQAHNIKLRKIAKKDGKKVSEYGVFRINPGSGKGTAIAYRTEEDVYKSLGMAWIPPELREDSGEVETALEGKLPGSLIKLTDIKGDLHVHTNETDGRNTIEEMALAAKNKGYEYIAITDHSKLVAVAKGMDETRLLKHIDRIRDADNRIKGIKILVGVEVDILKNGELDFSDSFLKELDIVIAAVHSNFSMDINTQTDRILRALDNKFVNILAHPSGRLITKRSPLELDMDTVFRRAKENGVILEVNTHGERVDLSDVNSRRAAGIGVKLAINTDSHGVEQLDQMMFGVISARRGWIKREDVVNTLPLPRMLAILRKKG